MYKKCALSVISAAVGLALLGQVKVYTNPAEQMQQIESPMILDVSLAEMVEQGEPEEWVTTSLRRYICHGVIVEKLSLEYDKDRGGKEYDILCILYLANIGDQDTVTSIKYELVLADKVLLNGSVNRFNTEEDERRIKRIKMKIPITECPDLSAAALHLSLFVTPD